jgi:hypothetical protein
MLAMALKARINMAASAICFHSGWYFIFEMCPDLLVHETQLFITFFSEHT